MASSGGDALPAFNESGDFPPGVYRATIDRVMERLGTGTFQRATVASRLARIHALVVSTGLVRRFIVFGSFVTAEPHPNDVDVFLLMEDEFRVDRVEGESRLIFDHAAADARFGASIFWIRRLAAFEGEDASVSHWQIKRDGRQRGIIEIVES